MNKHYCNHNQASNAEVDYVIDRILDGSFLFAPPVFIDNHGKRCHQPAELIDATTQKILSYRLHSQGKPSYPAPCQRCGCGCSSRINVYFDRVYKRMVQKGYIKEYPEVFIFKPRIGFGYYVLEINPLNYK
ncbi:MAG: hypothetical protein IJZ42_01805 [Lachnospiraceae bacterium]|nr:hypothetical protein [Lachnospiraceae bacterium]